VINEAPHFRYMSGGQVSVPIVMHCIGGARHAGAAQHSHSLHSLIWNTPGIKLALPSTASDLKGLFKTAVFDPNPVMIVTHERLYPIEEAIVNGLGPIPFGQALVRRPGRDLTVVATSLMIHYALQVSEQLSSEGIEAEVIDPRTLVPLDEETILESVRKTGRLVVVDETHLSCGVASEVAARVGYQAFRDLKAPIERVATLDVPIPFSPALEPQVIPTPERIAEAIRRAVRYG
jgi:pyruvate dehydrogenase E1 component beta subunit